jgi:peptidyl-prolyl cis-trans isomerase SurA
VKQFVVYFVGAALLATLSAAVPATAARSSLVAPNAAAQPDSRVASTDPNTDTAPLGLPNPATEPDEGDGIAAMVNDVPITQYDVRQRTALFVATSGVQPTPDNLKKMRSQILDSLETEQLQIQEAKRKNISVSMPEVDKQIDKIIEDNHMSIDQLKAMLAKQGVDFSTLRAQIAAQLVWQKAVEDEFQDRINVSQQDIDAELARQAEGADKPHFLVSEIFLAVETPDQDAKVLKNITDLQGQLQLGAPFQIVARQFSQSPSAASGGDIGWVHEGQLPEELNQALEKMTPGSVSAPIRSVGGYYILALRERQEAMGTKIPTAPTPAPSDKIPLARLLLPLGPKPTQQIAVNAMKMGAAIERQVNSCAVLPQVSQKIRGSVYMNLGPMKPTELSAEMQQALAKTEPGQPAPPFISEAGVELIFRCDKPVIKETAYQIPTRQQVEEQLFDQQVTAFARRYLRDLRRQADVETR